MNNLFQGYELKKPVKPPPHQLADHCERLCNKLRIPFSTIILRFLKKDEQLTESLVNYMASKNIKNIRYLVVAWNRQRNLALLRGKIGENRKKEAQQRYNITRALV